MRLDQDGAHARASGFLREFDIVEQPHVDIRRAVDVKVDRVFRKSGSAVMR
jgi:hypothetical protein